MRDATVRSRARPVTPKSRFSIAALSVGFATPAPAQQSSARLEALTATTEAQNESVSELVDLGLAEMDRRVSEPVTEAAVRDRRDWG